MFFTKCGYNCICPFLSQLYPFYVPTSSIKSDSIQNISILYQPSCPNGVHYVCTVSMSYRKYIHFFYSTSNFYPNNTPISLWDVLRMVDNIRVPPGCPAKHGWWFRYRTFARGDWGTTICWLMSTGEFLRSKPFHSPQTGTPTPSQGCRAARHSKRL